MKISGVSAVKVEGELVVFLAYRNEVVFGRKEMV